MSGGACSSPRYAPATEADAVWMALALEDAGAAARAGDVPVGAVVVLEQRLLGRGGNAVERLCDPTAHAELVAIRQAAAALGANRLLGATLYVTLEPCAMCAGAVVLARFQRVVFGTTDPKAGACGSLRNVVQDGRLNHRCELTGGVRQQECAEVLRRFFAARR